jgi:hypothetical protein
MFMLKPFADYGNDKKQCAWGVGLGPLDVMTSRDTLMPQKGYGLSLVDTLKEDLMVGDLFHGATPQEQRVGREACMPMTWVIYFRIH